MTELLDGYPTPIYNQGLFLPHLDLWLDAQQPQPVAVVTHAHSDHTALHGTIIATPETARLACYRRGAMQVIEVPYGESWQAPDGRYTLTMLPAGHILGSAQTLITEPNGRRTVYTGDFKLREPSFGPRAPIIPCDVLIMEATFGRPHYQFPPDSESVQRLHEQCRRALTEGITPIIFGYTLGKAQEALQYLLAGGFSVSVHGAIANMCDLHEALGASFPAGWERYNRHALQGKVLLAPTQSRKSLMIQNIERRYTIYLSGWGMDSNSKWRMGVDEVIPLSDHADWSDLLRYAEEAAPARLFTVHGFEELSAHLRARGHDAIHLPTHQMALF